MSVISEIRFTIFFFERAKIFLQEGGGHAVD